MTEQLRALTILRVEKVIESLESLVRQVEEWNSTVDEQERLEFDSDRKALQAARVYLAHLRANPEAVDKQLCERMLSAVTASHLG